MHVCVITFATIARTSIFDKYFTASAPKTGSKGVCRPSCLVSGPFVGCLWFPGSWRDIPESPDVIEIVICEDISSVRNSVWHGTSKHLRTAMADAALSSAKAIMGRKVEGGKVREGCSGGLGVLFLDVLMCVFL